jgi:hypothetical protein
MSQETYQVKKKEVNEPRNKQEWRNEWKLT